MMLLDQEKNFKVLDGLITDYANSVLKRYHPTNRYRHQSHTGLEGFYEDFKIYIQLTTPATVIDTGAVKPKLDFDQWLTDVTKPKEGPPTAIEDLVRAAEQYGKTDNIGMMLKCYTDIVQYHIKITDETHVDEAFKKVTCTLEQTSIYSPLLFSTLGVQLYLQARISVARLMFEEGLRQTSPDAKWVQLILLNNLGCLPYHSGSYGSQDNEYFSRAHHLLKEDISDECRFIIDKWFDLSCFKWIGSKTKFLKLHVEDILYLSKVILPTQSIIIERFHSLNPNESIRPELTSIIFFNISCARAATIEKRLRQQGDRLSSFLEELHRYSFFFNSEFTKIIEKLFGLPGDLDFFYNLLKVTMILSQEEQDLNIQLDTLVQAAREIYNNRSIIYEAFQNPEMLGNFLKLLPESEIFTALIGFPIYLYSQDLDRKWYRQEFLLDKVSLMSHATSTIQMENIFGIRY